MKQILIPQIALGLLLLPVSGSLAENEDLQMQQSRLLQNAIRVPAATNIPARIFLLDLAQTASIPMNVEIHRLKGAATDVAVQPVGSWDGKTCAIADVLTEMKRKVPAFSWQESERSVNLIVKDPSLTEDVLRLPLTKNITFSGSQMDFILWLGQAFPRFPVNYRERGGTDARSYTLDLKEGTTLRQILNSFAALAGESWIASIEYIPDATTDSDYKVIADLSFIRKGSTKSIAAPR